MKFLRSGHKYAGLISRQPVVITITNTDCCHFTYLKLDIEVSHAKAPGKGLINLSYTS